MQRLHSGTLSPVWSEFLTALIKDLEPLGHVISVKADGAFVIETRDPPEPKDIEQFWKLPHSIRHQRVIAEYRQEILDFERDFAPLFVDMARFQPSAVRPVLQKIDFAQPDHMRIVDYLRFYQTVTPSRPVARRMGLFIWDVGQEDTPRLFGAAVLAAAGYSQPIRDARFGWKRAIQKNRLNHDPVACDIREFGLERIMQLTMACALPPYSRMSGAWLATLAPFTALGLDAFKRSRSENAHEKYPDADLAAIVTTTAMAISGAPFRGHRIAQLAPKGVSPIPQANGNVYSRSDVPPVRPMLHASFPDLVSPAVSEMAVRLFAEQKPVLYAKRKDKQDAAMKYALKQCGLNETIFQANEMGVHIGALGADTLTYLQAGQPRPLTARPLLDWEQVVDVWTRRFLPAPTTIGESAGDLEREKHREGRQRRLEEARTVAADKVKLSSMYD